MKITKRQLKRIIKEEKARLFKEQPDIPDIMGAIGGGKFQPRKEAPETEDIRKVAANLLIKINKGVITGEPGNSDDELYIMTGEPQGYTVKVLRKGR